MRISDVSSDVCSSDLCLYRNRESNDPAIWHRGAFHLVCRAWRSQFHHRWRKWSASPPAQPERRSIGAELAHRRSASAGARSEEHTSELQSLMRISYAVFCLKKKKKTNKTHETT